MPTQPETDQTSPDHQEASPELTLSIAGDEAQPIFTFSKEGIVIRDDITEEEYKTGLGYFKDAKAKLDIRFSQYVAYGKLRWSSEKVDAMLGQLQFPLNDVRRAVQIASVPAAIRHDNLTSDHYVTLAKADITAAQRKKWAKTASEQRLSPAELKASIANGEVVSGTQQRQQHSGLASIHGVRMDFDVWERRVGGIDGVRKMKSEEREEIAAELKPIADFYMNLVAPIQSTRPKAKKAKKKAAAKA